MKHCAQLIDSQILIRQADFTLAAIGRRRQPTRQSWLPMAPETHQESDRGDEDYIADPGTRSASDIV